MCDRQHYREGLPNGIGILADKEVGVENLCSKGEEAANCESRENCAGVCGACEPAVGGGVIAEWGYEIVEVEIDGHDYAGAVDLREYEEDGETE
jgi:hypothetical protein